MGTRVYLLICRICQENCKYSLSPKSILHFIFFFFKVVSRKNSSKYLKINEQMVLVLAVLCVMSVVSRVLICICGCLNCKKLHLKIKVSI